MDWKEFNDFVSPLLQPFLQLSRAIVPGKLLY